MGWKLTAVGEVLWDLLPGGRQLGGAPANVAFHAKGLGADAAMISRVGGDDLGREIQAALAQRGLPVDLLQVDPTAPTGTVAVEVDANGQPSYTIVEDVAWDRLTATNAALERMTAADAVCFGSLAQRTPAARAAVQELVARSKIGPRPALVAFDVNLRPPFVDAAIVASSLAATDLLKLNDGELDWFAATFGLTGDAKARIAGLATRFGLRGVALTRGGDGSLLYVDGRWSDYVGPPVKVVDAVGAGDSFTAAVLLGLLNGWELDDVNQRANAVAAFVCTQPGATPTLPDALARPFLNG
ncbi:MAG: carbohydrate kinase family protein [Planctomycetia bacterium]